MTSRPNGRRIKLSVARRLVSDYMWLASGIARVDVSRRVAFHDVMAARAQLQPPPSWTAIFVKAFAIVAAEVPELRRVYMPYPWPHLYEYTSSTACVMHERQIDGDIGVLPVRVHEPNMLALHEIDSTIRRTVEAPIDHTKFHRKLIAVARLPLLLRRAILGLLFQIPRLRKEIGSFGISSAARWSTVLGTSRTPQPCLLSYGPADASGSVDVRLSFDHRIFDGALAGRALARLDEVLNSSILAELRDLAKPAVSAPPAPAAAGTRP